MRIVRLDLSNRNASMCPKKLDMFGNDEHSRSNVAK